MNIHKLDYLRRKVAAEKHSEELFARSEHKPRVYLLDLWCFIPYYIARLVTALRDQGVDTKLYSTRYHLDRSFFEKRELNPDTVLLDLGGSIQNPFFRRLVKSAEYVLNLMVLGCRLVRAHSTVLHVEYFPFIDRGFSIEIWFLKWVQCLGVPIVYTIHNVAHLDAPGRHKLVYGQAYRMADILICHSTDAASQLVHEFNIPEDKIRIIPHGPLFDDCQNLTTAAARALLGLPAEELLVLCLGVISKYKGIPFLLDAWKLLANSDFKGKLIIAGTGDPELLSSIRQYVSEANLTSFVDLRLTFVPVDQLPLLYSAADVLVYPYKAGTTSGALLTGLNYGKAIIATKLPFFQEYLKDGENALLVDYGDVDALASSLRLLLEDNGKRARIANSARKQGRQTSWPDIASATRLCYEHLIKNERPAESGAEAAH